MSRAIVAVVLLAAACSSNEGNFGSHGNGSAGTDGGSIDGSGQSGGASSAGRTGRTGGARNSGGANAGGRSSGTGGAGTGAAGAAGLGASDASTADGSLTDSSTNDANVGSGGSSGTSGAGGATAGSGGLGGNGGTAGSGGGSGTGGTPSSGGAPATGGAGGSCSSGPDAAALQCVRNSDCCAGKVCGDFDFSNPVKAYCGAPHPSGSPIGAACTGTLSPNSACSTGICASSLAACTALCTADADCNNASFLCRGSFINSTKFALCAKRCTGDPSCRTGQICVLFSSTTQDRLEKYCRAAPTTGSPPGTASTNPSTCDHGQTVIIGQEQYCTAPCDTNADCPAAVSKCQSFGFQTPITSTSITSGLCVKP